MLFFGVFFWGGGVGCGGRRAVSFPFLIQHVCGKYNLFQENLFKKMQQSTLLVNVANHHQNNKN